MSSSSSLSYPEPYSYSLSRQDADYDENTSIPICSPHNRISEAIGYRQETKVQFVVDAVYAFAEAIHSAWLDLCRGKKRVCKEIKEMDGGEFYKNYLLKVNFTGNHQPCIIFFAPESLILWLIPLPPFTLIMHALNSCSECSDAWYKNDLGICILTPVHEQMINF